MQEQQKANSAGCFSVLFWFPTRGFCTNRKVTDQLLEMPFLTDMAAVYGKTPAPLS